MSPNSERSRSSNFESYKRDRQRDGQDARYPRRQSVYNTPADLKLNAERINKIPLRVHLGLYVDETAELCQWHVGEKHYLEGWSDARAYDGTATIVQPLIAPLYDGKNAHEVLQLVFAENFDKKTTTS